MSTRSIRICTVILSLVIVSQVTGAFAADKGPAGPKRVTRLLVMESPLMPTWPTWDEEPGLLVASEQRRCCDLRFGPQCPLYIALLLSNRLPDLSDEQIVDLAFEVYDQLHFRTYHRVTTRHFGRGGVETDADRRERHFLSDFPREQTRTWTGPHGSLMILGIFWLYEITTDHDPYCDMGEYCGTYGLADNPFDGERCVILAIGEFSN